MGLREANDFHPSRNVCVHTSINEGRVKRGCVAAGN